MKPYYETENGKLFCGDCLEIMPIIPDGSVDLILTDPPYGTTACNWDSVIPFDEMWKHLNRIIKKNGAIVLFGSEPFSSALRMSNIKNYKYDWIWHKNNTSGFALAKKQPMRNHEIISVFYNKQCTYNYIKEPRQMSESSKKRMEYAFTSTKGINQQQNGIKKVQFIPEDKELSYPKTIKFFENIANNSKERVHPTQKPVALMEYLIKTYTNENEIVLDFTIGSGTTAVACEKTNRKWIGIEMLEKYCKIAKERIENEQEQLKLNL
jgi:site-specific DNA-methyltransferase (adenine-specific)